MLLGCSGMLLTALFLLGLVLRTDPGRFWQRKQVIVVATMSLLALISAIQAWSAYQSFAHFGLPLNAGYYDWYERIGLGVAGQLDSALTGFGTWAILFSTATLVLLCLVGKAPGHESPRPTLSLSSPAQQLGILQLIEPLVVAAAR